MSSVWPAASADPVHIRPHVHFRWQYPIVSLRGDHQQVQFSQQSNKTAEPSCGASKLPEVSEVCTEQQGQTDIHTGCFLCYRPPIFFFPAHIPRGEHTLSDGRCDGVLSFFSLSPSMNVSNGNDRDYEGRDITPASLRVGGPQPFPLWPSVNVRALLPIGLCISNIRGMFSQYVCHSSKKEFRLCVYDVQIVLDISIDLSVLNYF